MEELSKAVARYGEAHADTEGLALTPLRGLSVVHATARSDLVHGIWRPLVCLVVQGCKQVTLGLDEFELSAGRSMLIAADVPVVSRITQATPEAPYLAVVVELDMALVADLTTQLDVPAEVEPASVSVEATEFEVADAVWRLMRTLDRPAALPVLGEPLLRELHYWLLTGVHGTAIRQLGLPDGHVRRIARAVSMLRAEFAQPMPIERLAAAAAMSPSSFHRHFRTVTSLSPLQFQKQLRLIEARRLMLSEGATPGNAAFAVGYQSVPHFTREYSRMFGSPPVRHRLVVNLATNGG